MPKGFCVRQLSTSVILSFRFAIPHFIMHLQSFLKPVGLVSAGALLIAAVSAAEDKPVSLGIVGIPALSQVVWGKHPRD